MITKIRKTTYTLLRKSEKYTKTDMIELFKGGSLISFSYIYNSLLSLILLYFFANFLPIQMYGEYKYILSGIGLLTAFTLTGANTAIIRSIANNHDGSLSVAYKKSLTYSFIFFLTSVGISTYYFINQNTTLGSAFLVGAFLQPLFQASDVYIGFLNGKKDFINLAKYQSVRVTLSTITMILVGYLFQSTFLLITINLASQAIFSLFAYKASLRRIKNRNVDPDFVKVSKHYSIANSISYIATQLDKILLFQLLGAQQLATYAIALIVPDQTKGLIKNIVNPLAAPAFAKKTTNKDLYMKNILMKTAQLLLLLVPLVVIYYFIADEVFMFLFPKYIESIELSKILFSSIVFTAVIPKTAIDSKKMIRENYILKFSTSILKIILVLIGVISGGLLGVVMAVFVARLITFIATIGLFVSGMKNDNYL